MNGDYQTPLLDEHGVGDPTGHLRNVADIEIGTSNGLIIYRPDGGEKVRDFEFMSYCGGIANSYRIRFQIGFLSSTILNWRSI